MTCDVSEDDMRCNRVCAVLVAVMAPILLSVATAQTTDGSIYRVTTQLVAVDTQVLDKKSGHALLSLKEIDFQIYEDKVPQKITAFSQDELPLSIVLLFDLTDSVRPVLKPLAKGALQALKHLKAEDEVAVMTYSASARLLQDFTTDRTMAVNAIQKASRMESGEAAFFNEGIYQAAARLGSTNPMRRRVIVWLTDDVPNFPSEEIRARYGRSLGKNKLHSEKDAAEELLRTGTVVCTLLQLSQMSDNEFSLRRAKPSETMINTLLYPPGEVHRYAQISGGHVMDSGGNHIDEQLATLIDDIRLRYNLGYHPQGDKPKGKYCTIQVKLSPEAKKSHPAVTIEARQGYFR